MKEKTHTSVISLLLSPLQRHQLDRSKSILSIDFIDAVTFHTLIEFYFKLYTGDKVETLHHGTETRVLTIMVQNCKQRQSKAMVTLKPSGR